MKEEWKKVEEGYENALKELEKNVHMLVDVREDEVEAKIQSMTKAYEHKINRMRIKLEKYEDLLKAEAKGDGDGSSKHSGEKDARPSSKGPDKLVVPNTHLCRKLKRMGNEKNLGNPDKETVKEDRLNKLFSDESYNSVGISEK